MQNPRQLTDEEIAMGSEPVARPAPQWDTFQETGELAAAEGPWYPRATVAAPQIFPSLGRAVGDIWGLVNPTAIGEGLAGLIIRDLEEGEGFTEQQQHFGRLVADVFRLQREHGRRRREMDESLYMGEEAAPLEPIDYAERTPHLHQAAQGLEYVTPYHPDEGWRGTARLSRVIEQEPGEFLLDVGLSATGIGLGTAAVRGGVQGLRAARRGLSPLDDIATHLDDVDILTGELSPTGQLRRATLDIEVQGGRSWDIRDPRQFGRHRVLERGTGTIVSPTEAVTASHVLTGQADVDLPDIQRVVGRTFTGEQIQIPTVSGVLPEADIAALNLPELRGAMPLDLAADITEATPLLGRDPTGVGYRQGVVAAEMDQDPITGATIRQTSYVGRGGLSGAGLVTEAGELGGIYLGTRRQQGMFADAGTVARFLEGDRPTYRVGDFDREFHRERLQERALYYGGSEIGAASRLALRGVGGGGEGLALHSDDRWGSVLREMLEEMDERRRTEGVGDRGLEAQPATVGGPSTGILPGDSLSEILSMVGSTRGLYLGVGYRGGDLLQTAAMDPRQTRGYRQFLAEGVPWDEFSLDPGSTLVSEGRMFSPEGIASEHPYVVREAAPGYRDVTELGQFVRGLETLGRDDYTLHIFRGVEDPVRARGLGMGTRSPGTMVFAPETLHELELPRIRELRQAFSEIKESGGVVDASALPPDVSREFLWKYRGQDAPAELVRAEGFRVEEETSLMRYPILRGSASAGMGQAEYQLIQQAGRAYSDRIKWDELSIEELQSEFVHGSMDRARQELRNLQAEGRSFLRREGGLLVPEGALQAEDRRLDLFRVKRTSEKDDPALFDYEKSSIIEKEEARDHTQAFQAREDLEGRYTPEAEGELTETAGVDAENVYTQWVDEGGDFSGRGGQPYDLEAEQAQMKLELQEGEAEGGTPYIEEFGVWDLEMYERAGITQFEDLFKQYSGEEKVGGVSRFEGGDSPFSPEIQGQIESIFSNVIQRGTELEAARAGSGLLRRSIIREMDARNPGWRQLMRIAVDRDAFAFSYEQRPFFEQAIAGQTPEWRAEADRLWRESEYEKYESMVRPVRLEAQQAMHAEQRRMGGEPRWLQEHRASFVSDAQRLQEGRQRRVEQVTGGISEQPSALPPRSSVYGSDVEPEIPVEIRDAAIRRLEAPRRDYMAEFREKVLREESDIDKQYHVIEAEFKEDEWHKLGVLPEITSQQTLDFEWYQAEGVVDELKREAAVQGNIMHMESRLEGQIHGFRGTTSYVQERAAAAEGGPLTAENLAAKLYQQRMGDTPDVDVFGSLEGIGIEYETLMVGGQTAARYEDVLLGEARQRRAPELTWEEKRNIRERTEALREVQREVKDAEDAYEMYRSVESNQQSVDFESISRELQREIDRAKDKERRVSSGVELHSAGGVDSDYIWRFLSDEDRQRRGLSRGVFAGLDVSESIDYLRERYPGAESLDDLILRAEDTGGVFFRSQPGNYDLLGHRSYDLALTKRYRHHGFLPRSLQGRGIQVDWREGKSFVTHPGVFASEDFVEAERYLGGLIASSGETLFAEGGDQLRIFQGVELPRERLLEDQETIVEPRSEVYRVNQEVFSRGLQRAPAELFAVDPRRRYLEGERPFDEQYGTYTPRGTLGDLLRRELEDVELHAAGDDLTPSQRRAMEHTYGPATVIAGPGSGKSRTLLERLRYLSEENIATSDDVLTLVFGKKAAEDLQQRASGLGGDWNIQTVDAFARSVVRDNFGQLRYDRAPDISKQTFEGWLRTTGKGKEYGLSDDAGDLGEWNRLYEEARSGVMSGREDYSQLPEDVQRGIHAFRLHKFQTGVMDHTDAISQAGYLLESNEMIRQQYQERYKFLQVDEYQDVSPLQSRLLRNLSPNPWVVGDLDQSIMGFRGGTGQAMREMISTGASVYNIVENFRSTPEIVGAAQGFIGSNLGRLDVSQQAVKSSGDPVDLVGVSPLSTEQEAIGRIAEQIRPGEETAILTRTHRELGVIESELEVELRERGWEAEDIKSSLVFQTLHASKGREWQNVILPVNLLESDFGNRRSLQTLPSPYAKTAEDFAEEERLFYVGMTRAEDRLTIMADPSHPYFQAVQEAVGEERLERVDYLEPEAVRESLSGSGGGFRGLVGRMGSALDRFVHGSGRTRRTRRRGDDDVELHSLSPFDEDVFTRKESFEENVRENLFGIFVKSDVDDILIDSQVVMDPYSEDVNEMFNLSHFIHGEGMDRDSIGNTDFYRLMGTGFLAEGRVWTNDHVLRSSVDRSGLAVRGETFHSLLGKWDESGHPFVLPVGTVSVDDPNVFKFGDYRSFEEPDSFSSGLDIASIGISDLEGQEGFRISRDANYLEKGLPVRMPFSSGVMNYGRIRHSPLSRTFYSTLESKPGQSGSPVFGADDSVVGVVSHSSGFRRNEGVWISKVQRGDALPSDYVDLHSLSPFDEDVFDDLEVFPEVNDRMITLGILDDWAQNKGYVFRSVDPDEDSLQHRSYSIEDDEVIDEVFASTGLKHQKQYWKSNDSELSKWSNTGGSMLRILELSDEDSRLLKDSVGRRKESNPDFATEVAVAPKGIVGEIPFSAVQEGVGVGLEHGYSDDSLYTIMRNYGDNWRDYKFALPEDINLHSLSPFDEDVFTSPIRGQGLGLGARLARGISETVDERGWGGATHQVASIAQNAALINVGASLAVEGVRTFAGHDLNVGSFIHAGASSMAALGATMLDARFGSAGVLPESRFNLQHLGGIVRDVPEDAGMHLQRIFERAGAGTSRWGRGSLSGELERYDWSDLESMFGESGTQYLTELGYQTRRFGQKSHQTQRDWSETLLGLYSGDFSRSRRYAYDPESRQVSATQSRRWTLDRLLESGQDFAPIGAWRARREQLREDPSQDWLARVLGPLQGEDVTPHVGYMFLPEARGIGRFFGRFHAEPENPWIQNWGLEDIARGVGAEDWADRMARRKEFREDRQAMLESRRMDPSLYQWQDPDHFYSEIAGTLGIGGEAVSFGSPRLGSPYSRFGRHLSQLPRWSGYPLAAGAGLGIGSGLYDLLLGDDDDETLRLGDPAGYSLSVRYPVLGALQRTRPYRRLRARGEELLDDLYGEDSFHGEMLKSMVLGKKGNLPQETKETFVQTGQIHALVQSGMHVSLFGGLLSRYPALMGPAAFSAARDMISPPNEEVVEASQSYWDKYTPSDSPWAPRFNPELPSEGEIRMLRSRGLLPDDYEFEIPDAPFWAWWDPAENYARDEDKRRQRKLSDTMDEGYIYIGTNVVNERQYVGLSTRDPEGKGGRISKHLSGRGSELIADDLREGAQPYHFDFDVLKFEDISYYQLGQMESHLIDQLGTQDDGYNISAGGEIRNPNYEYKEREGVKLQRGDIGVKDILPWSVYGMFGVLPEAGLSYFRTETGAEEPALMDAEPGRVEKPSYKIGGFEFDVHESPFPGFNPWLDPHPDGKAKSEIEKMNAPESPGVMSAFDVSPLLWGEGSYDAFSESVQESVVKIESGGSFGTGFFVDENIIATNYHVIDSAQNVDEVSGEELWYNPGLKVYVPGREEPLYTERVLGVDTFNDIALLRVPDIEGEQALELLSEMPQTEWFESSDGSDVEIPEIIRMLGYPGGVGRKPQFDVGAMADVLGPDSDKTAIAKIDIEFDLGSVYGGESGSPLFGESGEGVFGMLWGRRGGKGPGGGGLIGLGTSSRDIQRLLSEVRESGALSAPTENFIGFDEVVFMGSPEQTLNDIRQRGASPGVEQSWEQTSTVEDINERYKRLGIDLSDGLDRDEARLLLDDDEALRSAKKRSDVAEKPSAPSAKGKGVDEKRTSLDIRTATLADFESLPGIGLGTAQRIVDYRSQHPNMRATDLSEVKGIGEKTEEKLLSFFGSIGGGGGPRGFQSRGLVEGYRPFDVPYSLSRMDVSERVDLNIGRAEEFERIGLSSDQTQSLLSHRAVFPFSDVSDVMDVRGIGKKTFQQIQHGVMVEDVPRFQIDSPVDLSPYVGADMRGGLIEDYASQGKTVPENVSMYPSRAFLDLGTATAEQLEKLPGIGETTAGRIVDYRRKHPSMGVSDLSEVFGISQRTEDILAPFFQVSSPAPLTDDLSGVRGEGREPLDSVMGFERAVDPRERVASGKLDIRTATAGQLDALPGIGPALAGRIVDYREEHPEMIPSQLAGVRGISEEQAIGLSSFFREPAAAAPSISIAGREPAEPMLPEVGVAGVQDPVEYRYAPTFREGLEYEAMMLPEDLMRGYMRGGFQGLTDTLKAAPMEAIQRQGLRVARNYGRDLIGNILRPDQAKPLDFKNYLGDFGGLTEGLGGFGAALAPLAIAGATAFVGAKSLDANYAEVIPTENEREQAFYENLRQRIEAEDDDGRGASRRGGASFQTIKRALREVLSEAGLSSIGDLSVGVDRANRVNEARGVTRRG